MKVTSQHKNFVVIDDFLTAQDFESLWNFIQDERFEYVHSKKWIKAFQASDGNPFWGGVYLSHALTEDSESTVYPSNKGIDPFIKGLLTNHSLYKDYAGTYKKDWTHFFCRPYIYPKNGGLSWHTDGRGDVTGAYVYYAHQKWHAQWGAELLIDDSENYDLTYPDIKMYDGSVKKLGLHLDNAPANEAVLEHGIGHYIVAKPNRLVILKRGVLHRIKRVDEAAGDQLRISLTGFFRSTPIAK